MIYNCPHCGSPNIKRRIQVTTRTNNYGHDEVMVTYKVGSYIFPSDGNEIVMAEWCGECRTMFAPGWMDS